VRLCDPMWHMSTCSSEGSCKLLYSVYLTIPVLILCIGVTVQGSEGQLLLLRLACSANSHARNIVLHRQHGSSLWPPFDVTVASHISGCVSSAFITCADAPARQLGLRTGDQVCFRSEFLWTEIFVQTLHFDGKC